MKATLMACLLLAVTAAYVVLHPPANLAAGHGVLRGCPERFGDWNGTDLSFEDAVVDELKADDLLSTKLGEETVNGLTTSKYRIEHVAHDGTLVDGYV